MKIFMQQTQIFQENMIHRSYLIFLFKIQVPWKKQNLKITPSLFLNKKFNRQFNHNSIQIVSLTETEDQYIFTLNQTIFCRMNNNILNTTTPIHQIAVNILLCITITTRGGLTSGCQQPIKLLSHSPSSAGHRVKTR